MQVDELLRFMAMAGKPHLEAAFAYFYFFGTLAAVVGYFWWRRQQQRASETPFPDDPYVVAAMTGGAIRVVQSGIISLARSGAIVLGGAKGIELTIAGPLPDDASDVERCIYHEIARIQPVRAIQLTQEAAGLPPIQETVWNIPLIPSDSRMPGLWLLPLKLFAIVGLVVLGCRAYLRYVSNEIHSFTPYVYCVFSSLAGFSGFGAKNSPRKKVLARIMDLHPLSGASLIPANDAREWAFAVAIHGPTALKSTVFSDYLVQFGHVR